MSFIEELTNLLNRHSQENASNTPDFILAQFLGDVLKAWNVGVQQREAWYGRDQRPSLTAALAPETAQKCSTCGATDPNENQYCSNGFHAVPSRPVETPAKETAK